MASSKEILRTTCIPPAVWRNFVLQGFKEYVPRRLVWAACTVSVLSLEARFRYSSYATTRSRAKKRPASVGDSQVPLPESTWKRLHGESYRRGTLIKPWNRKTLVSPNGAVCSLCAGFLFGRHIKDTGKNIFYVLWCRQWTLLIKWITGNYRLCLIDCK